MRNSGPELVRRTARVHHAKFNVRLSQRAYLACPQRSYDVEPQHASNESLRLDESSYRIAIVVDPAFGDRLDLLAQRMHVWAGSSGSDLARRTARLRHARSDPRLVGSERRFNP